MTLNEKIKLIENNWIYFLSFSLWVSALVTRFPTMIENGLLGVLFPLLLMNASSSTGPVPVRIPSNRFYMGWIERFPVFYIVEKFTDIIVYLIHLYNSKWLRRNANS
jgi:hypothetical protein